MSSKHKHEKKTNVVNRTTSETLRLGESTSGSLSVQSLPQTSRKKIQNSSSSFQITGVSLTRLDFGEDSADDLDESHTDDISRVTDNETPSFSEDSRDTDDHQEAAAAPNTAIKVTETELRPKLPSQNTGARFKVVKMPSTTPFSRGRWTCFDYLDNSESAQSFNKPLVNGAHVQEQTGAKVAVGVTGGVCMEAIFHGNTFLSYKAPHSNLHQSTKNGGDKPMKDYSQGYVSVMTSEGCNLVKIEHEIIKKEDQKPATQSSAMNVQKVSSQ